jgi:hypothetical protein
MSIQDPEFGGDKVVESAAEQVVQAAAEHGDSLLDTIVNFVDGFLDFFGN